MLLERSSSPQCVLLRKERSECPFLRKERSECDVPHILNKRLAQISVMSKAQISIRLFSDSPALPIDQKEQFETMKSNICGVTSVHFTDMYCLMKIDTLIGLEDKLSKFGISIASTMITRVRVPIEISGVDYTINDGFTVDIFRAEEDYVSLSRYFLDIEEKQALVHISIRDNTLILENNYGILSRPDAVDKALKRAIARYIWPRNSTCFVVYVNLNNIIFYCQV